ncbi:camp-dependent protein kinase catalytic subunit [Rhizopus stolonifer]|uniref:cAMP-dependent protein kinase n=1 Tax=Rhizopus stolonifer TaxID=4846 RepID=A0A367INM0_RHIST|nr:camp-dependent protein kinase catalytic subunit [Rhizopus stolonifer]
MFTPMNNGTDSHHHSPPHSPVNNNKKAPIPIIQKSTHFDNHEQQDPIVPKSAVPDYLSSSPTHASPLSPLPPQGEQQVDSYFSLDLKSESTAAAPAPPASTLSVPDQTSQDSVTIPPRSPTKSHFTPRPVHVTRVSTHAVPRARSSNTKQRRQKHRKLRLDDFVLKRTVGTGSFGRVHLAQSKVNGKHYAIKALDKYDIVRLKQVEHINNEPTILREISHPFLVTLWDAFQDDTHLFMVMDYVPGGELFSMLRKEKKFSEQTAKFYAAEVLLALAYLHENGIVYRDLKPENILIDARGHVKLTDFGFAKRVDDMTWTVCGTPDYLAPEIILSKGYTKAVDWWGLGVLIFEMVVGRAPFIDKNPVNLYQKILECRIDWPEDMSPELKDLLQNLLTNDIEGRFTSEEIKTHAWFKDTSFEQVVKRKNKPPFVPKVKDDGDTNCFAKYKEPVHLYGHIRGDIFSSKFPAF